jgi:hypothetical protein
MKRNPMRGVATVPIILVFGILIVAIGIGIAALSFSESLASQGGYQSTRALLYAEAGARDALERIARNKNYSCTSADCYELDLASGGCANNSACARMSVSGGVGSEADPKIVTATGRAGINLRTLQVSVTLDSSQFGQIASTTWKELVN